MTIQEIKQGPRDEASISQGKETYKVPFVIKIDTATTTALEVERASGTVSGVTYPAYGAANAIDSSLKVINKTAKRCIGSDGKAAKYHWAVDVEYGLPNFSGPTGNTENSGNVRISVSGAETSIYTQLALDADSTPIVNSVGDIYPDPIESVIYDETITIEYEADTIDGAAIAAIRGKINDDTITLSIPQGTLTYSRTWTAHQILVKSVDYNVVVSRSDNTAHKWGVRVVLLGREDTWDLELPDKGYRYMVEVGESIFDSSSSSSGGETGDENGLCDWKDTAQYLDGNGFRLTDGSPIVTLPLVQRYTEADVTTFLEAI
jgi:hypothetical protein